MDARACIEHATICEVRYLLNCVLCSFGLWLGVDLVFGSVLVLGYCLCSRICTIFRRH